MRSRFERNGIKPVDKTGKYGLYSVFLVEKMMEKYEPITTIRKQPKKQPELLVNDPLLTAVLKTGFLTTTIREERDQHG